MLSHGSKDSFGNDINLDIHVNELVIVLTTLEARIISLINEKPGLTDRQIADELLGKEKHQSPVNIGCRALEQKGIVIRKIREDERIGNYPSGKALPEARTKTVKISSGKLSEDDIKKILESDLQKAGWSTDVAYGGQHGIDIDAHRGKERWIIEVKGPGSLDAMRVNYFIGILGEILQRMNDPNAKYSIALPDLEQFRRLWKRLPALAKERTGISILFVNWEGRIIEEK